MTEVKQLTGLSELKLKTEYRTGDDDLICDFYIPCLEASCKYDRAVGYFRSSIFVIVGQSVIDFAKRGGKIRLLCSPSLSQEDIDALAQGYTERDQAITDSLHKDIESLLAEVDTREHTLALATLISVGAMDVRIVLRPPNQGLFHEKLGIFHDEQKNTVSFKGSSNETWSGWHTCGNLESFEVFWSWTEDEIDRTRIQNHQSYFERLWNDNVDQVETVPFPKVTLEALREIAYDDLDDIKLVSSFKSQLSAKKKRKPFPHQIQALENWEANGKRGILEHATGSGKTFTAITALKEHLEDDGVAIVLVPSLLLLTQWEKELKAEIDNLSLLIAGGDNTIWKKQDRLESFSARGQGLGQRIILSTLQTACKPEFRNRIRAGNHLMLVSDEAHRIGSREFSSVLEIETGPRLGLSATPVRYGDPEGTDRIFTYFNGVVPPPFTLNDAIKAGRLVPYEYFPHCVELDEHESIEWDELTKKINREYAKCASGSDGTVQHSDRLKLLLIQRSRVVKKARSKVALAKKIVREHYRKGDSWLVYCEDSDQLSQVLAEFRSLGVPVDEYHTGMDGDAAETLKWFKHFGGIIVSIRCLDEGVDIPAVSHALILASSQNPREFIQRRGRVLRISPEKPEKKIAVIHDAIVVPSSVSGTYDQVSITKSEIQRSLEFSKNALNRNGEIEILNLAASLGIDLDEIDNLGFEDDGHE